MKDLNKIVKYMTSDKKNFTNKINFITIRKIGKVDINKQISITKIKKFIKMELLK